MREFRYNDVARTFDEELEAEMVQHEAEKTAKKQPPPAEAESGLQRIAKGKTPLDEVRAIIEASTRKSAAQEVAEFRVRRKLAEMRDAPKQAVDNFLNLAKDLG